MEITNTIFETLLTKNNFKKKEFAQYSKIPYNTVVGWKKKNSVPAYAMVILKDMIYRKKLEEITENLIFKDKRFICFCGSIEQCNYLGGENSIN